MANQTPTTSEQTIELIGSYGKELTENLNQDISESISTATLMHLGKLVAAILILVVLIRIFGFVVDKVRDLITKDKDQRFKTIKFRNLELLSARNFFTLVSTIISFIKVLGIIVLIYFFFTYAFGIFPATSGIAQSLVKYFSYLAKVFASSLLAFVPNLLTIVFIAVVTYYFIQFLKFIARALYYQRISFTGFKREWIFPTYKIFQFFIVVFAVIMIFPYLPGADSPAFKGVSVFVGLLVTLGSSSAIANIIAGIVLIYMSPYKVGDRVKLGDITGNIFEIGLLVTRIRTIKNEDVTIPNSTILAKETINYSASISSEKDLILYLEVGLGYDVDRQQAEDLLLASVQDVEGIFTDPEAFVLVKSLDNHFITYELNAYVSDADLMPQAKSNLFKNILDNFAAANVAILSPAVVQMKQG